MRIFFLNRAVQIVAILGPLATPTAFAQTANETSSLVVPPHLANTFSGPFSGDFFYSAGMSEELFSSSLFNGATSDIINITGIAFREAGNSKGSIDVVVPRLTLSLGVFPGSIDNLPAKGFPISNPQIVYDQSNVTIKAVLGSPQDFNVLLSFNTPFTYDRRSGQLVLTSFRPSSSVGVVQNLDGEFTQEAAYYRRAGDGTVESISIIPATKFFYSAVPEPDTSVLGIFGGATILALNWYRARKKG